MANSSALIYFPPKLSDTPEDPLRQALTDREYARVQIDLVKAVYARAAVLDTDHPQPEVIAFLEVFVNLIDTMEVNGPEHAHVCMRELKKSLTLYILPSSMVQRVRDYFCTGLEQRSPSIRSSRA